MIKPPDGLVPLSSIPNDRWLGRLVLHPMCQIGDVPYWRPADAPHRDPEEEHPEVYSYDVGFVKTWERGGEWMQDDGTDHQEVTFRLAGTEDSTLHYGEYNLWTYPGDHVRLDHSSGCVTS